MICIELEDGVGPEQKDLARENMLTLLAGLSAENTGKTGTQAEILVRVNHPETAAGQVICQPFYLCRPVQSG